MRVVWSSMAMFVLSSAANAQAALTGYVRDDESLRGLQGVELSVTPGDKHVRTDKEGKYTLRDLAAGSVRVHVVRARRPVNITRHSASRPLNASLSRNAECSVMSGARACLGCSSALARFAAQSHARRAPARVHDAAPSHLPLCRLRARRPRAPLCPAHPPIELHARARARADLHCALRAHRRNSRLGKNLQIEETCLRLSRSNR